MPLRHCALLSHSGRSSNRRSASVFVSLALHRRSRRSNLTRLVVPILLTASACSGGGSAPSYPFGADDTSGTGEGTEGIATVDDSGDSGGGGTVDVDPLPPIIGVNVDVDNTLMDLSLIHI